MGLNVQWRGKDLTPESMCCCLRGLPNVAVKASCCPVTFAEIIPILRSMHRCVESSTPSAPTDMWGTDLSQSPISIGKRHPVHEEMDFLSADTKMDHGKSLAHWLAAHLARASLVTTVTGLSA